MEYQWNPIRCAKCKRFGHDCSKVHTAPHIPKKPNYKQVLNPEPSEVEGEWKIKGKGRSVNVDGPPSGLATSTCTVDGVAQSEDPPTREANTGQLLVAERVPKGSNPVQQRPITTPHVITTKVTTTNQFAALLSDPCEDELINHDKSNICSKEADALVTSDNQNKEGTYSADPTGGGIDEHMDDYEEGEINVETVSISEAHSSLSPH